jgi:hypothetical protein
MVTWSVLDHYQAWASDQDAQAARDWPLTTLTLLYDVSDPAAPEHLQTFTQSGGYSGARVVEGVLYVVTDHSVSWLPVQPVQDEPTTYVPQVGDSSGTRPIASARILIAADVMSPDFSSVTSVDLASRQRVGELALLGGAGAHFTPKAVYLASARGGLLYGDSDSTDLTRVALDGGELAVQAQGSVEGGLPDPSALDEHGGELRVITNLPGSDAVDDSRLTVLDADLKQVGRSAPLMGGGHAATKAQFAGDRAYAVLFRRDGYSLTALDLTDPAAPRESGATDLGQFAPVWLESPEDGTLLAVGETGYLDEGHHPPGIRIMAFDVLDPGAPGETSTLDAADELPSFKDNTLLFDQASGLYGVAIGHPVEQGRQGSRYLVFSARGGDLTVKADLGVAEGRVGPTFAYPVRAVPLDGGLYICSRGGVVAASLGSFGEEARVVF